MNVKHDTKYGWVLRNLKHTTILEKTLMAHLINMMTNLNDWSSSNYHINLTRLTLTLAI